VRYFSDVFLSGCMFSISDNPGLIRWASLLVLVVQNAALVLVMRYSRTRPGDMYISTTAVVMAETMKLIFCLAMTLYEHQGNVSSWLHYLNEVSCYSVTGYCWVFQLEFRRT